jgi:hypothetical protein
VAGALLVILADFYVGQTIKKNTQNSGSSIGNVAGGNDDGGNDDEEDETFRHSLVITGGKSWHHLTPRNGPRHKL